MKKYSLSVALCTLSLILIFSCKKSNSGGNSSTAANSYLSAVVSIAPQQKMVDSFYYDSTAHLLDTFTQSIYDTTSGYPLYNSYTIQFIYQGTNTFPSWYYLYDVSYGNYGDYHLLSYDGQGRISKDTSLSGSGYVTYYSYPNNNVVIDDWFEGTSQDNQIDTLYMSNGNLNEETIYTSNIPGQPDQQQADVQYKYNTSANPAFHATISDAIGPILYNITQTNNGGFIDFLSKNVLHQASGTESSSPGIFSLTYVQTLDNKGRLSELTGPGGVAAGSIVFNYY
jgi:hypothetical protein